LASQSLTLAVVGPTASGKTDLGLELARRVGGEIVSADSRQVYKRLDAGTAKPAGKWTEAGGRRVFVVEGVPYHLVDILDPKETMDAARYAEMARPLLEEIHGRGRRPIVVGGTGLYLRALFGGLDPLPKRNPEIREKLAELADANGREWLHDELERVDPEAAGRIPPNNIHRVVRALEVYQLTGKPISSQWTKGGGEEGAALYFGVQWERAALRERIRIRCEAMFPRMLEEARRLVPSEYSGKEPGFQSLGYPQALRCLSGEMTEAQALASMIRDTADYAKRQATWFRRQTPARWIEAGAGSPRAWADEMASSLEAVP